MKKEIFNLFAILEKYSINFNEYMLAKMIAWGQANQNAEVVEEYFSMRMCARGNTIELLEGLKNAKIIGESYEIPQKGSNLDLHSIPMNEELAKELLQEN
ncbi:hypothetical protein F2Y87_27855 [Bacteroides cellulosilyticus]|uniref:Uncharacterized protein n=1 Tax=Bacteroides cellulosilyticus TaxID=246787 RepID=A0A6L3JQY2_9BACE|nr:hypothetical protein [Bacteroides cellulosilyticus]KAA5412411.1 hypothetical protein F2Y87_27855 [Bacteroides cellulosilyticus]